MHTYRSNLNTKTTSSRPRRRCTQLGGLTPCDYEIRVIRVKVAPPATVGELLQRRASGPSPFGSGNRLAYVCRYCHREQNC